MAFEAKPAAPGAKTTAPETKGAPVFCQFFGHGGSCGLCRKCGSFLDVCGVGRHSYGRCVCCHGLFCGQCAGVGGILNTAVGLPTEAETIQQLYERYSEGCCRIYTQLGKADRTIAVKSFTLNVFPFSEDAGMFQINLGGFFLCAGCAEASNGKSLQDFVASRVGDILDERKEPPGLLSAERELWAKSFVENKDKIALERYFSMLSDSSSELKVVYSIALLYVTGAHEMREMLQEIAQTRELLKTSEEKTGTPGVWVVLAAELTGVMTALGPTHAKLKLLAQIANRRADAPADGVLCCRALLETDPIPASQNDVVFERA